MPHLEQLPYLISATMNFKVMGINTIFKYQVMVTFEYVIAALVFHTKVINVVVFITM